MTPYNKLPRQHRKIIDAFRMHSNKLNSLRFRYLAIQLPVRIKELREEHGWNIPYPTKSNPDRSVDYVLLPEEPAKYKNEFYIDEEGRPMSRQVPVNTKLVQSNMF